MKVQRRIENITMHFQYSIYSTFDLFCLGKGLDLGDLGQDLVCEAWGKCGVLWGRTTCYSVCRAA